MPIDIYTVIFLISSAAVAGFVDAICGGGGLLSIPILLSTGITPM